MKLYDGHIFFAVGWYEEPSESYDELHKQFISEMKECGYVNDEYTYKLLGFNSMLNDAKYSSQETTETLFQAYAMVVKRK